MQDKEREYHIIKKIAPDEFVLILYQEVFIHVFLNGGGDLCRPDPILHAQTYAPYAYATRFLSQNPMPLCPPMPP